VNRAIGVDLGARTTKIVELVDGATGQIRIFDTGHDPIPAVREALDGFHPAPTMATGYGRHLLRERLGANCITEIRAAAVGARRLCPGCRTVIDVGGQDCKAIALTEAGGVADFQMNDRCAAGTGRFLEMMARTFDTDIPSFARLARESREHAAINSMCAVFAESEVVSLITSGQPRARIARGLHVSAAARIAAMARRVPVEDQVVLIGGGALNACLADEIQSELGHAVLVPAMPQLATALGAALACSSTDA
jgi:predicted CoA-substrate-specific enzyme activase